MLGRGRRAAYDDGQAAAATASVAAAAGAGGGGMLEMSVRSRPVTKSVDTDAVNAVNAVCVPSRNFCLSEGTHLYTVRHFCLSEGTHLFIGRDTNELETDEGTRS